MDNNIIKKNIINFLIRNKLDNFIKIIINNKIANI